MPPGATCTKQGVVPHFRAPGCLELRARAGLRGAEVGDGDNPFGHDLSLVIGLLATVLPGIFAAFVGIRAYAELQLLAE